MNYYNLFLSCQNKVNQGFLIWVTIDLVRHNTAQSDVRPHRSRHL